MENGENTTVDTHGYGVILSEMQTEIITLHLLFRLEKTKAESYVCSKYKDIILKSSAEHIASEYVDCVHSPERHALFMAVLEKESELGGTLYQFKHKMEELAAERWALGLPTYPYLQTARRRTKTVPTVSTIRSDLTSRFPQNARTGIPSFNLALLTKPDLYFKNFCSDFIETFTSSQQGKILRTMKVVLNHEKGGKLFSSGCTRFFSLKEPEKNLLEGFINHKIKSKGNNLEELVRVWFGVFARWQAWSNKRRPKQRKKRINEIITIKKASISETEKTGDDLMGEFLARILNT